MSTFSSVNLASRALAAAQRQMDVTGQNIANANTEGYSRQRVEQTATTAATGTWAARGTAGTGVEVTGITRIADALTDAAARQDAATAAEQQATARVWSGVEDGLGEPGTGGLSQQLADMHEAWGDLVNANGTEAAGAARALVISRSQAVAATLNGLDSQLRAQWEGQATQVGVLAAQASTAAGEVARLNEAILTAGTTGASPNELIDQRESALTRLAELTGARVVQREHGTVDVYIGSAAVVRGGTAEVVRAGEQPTLDQIRTDGARFTLTVGGTPAVPVAGKLKSALDALTTTLPQVAAQFDAVAQKVAGDVNAIYRPASGQDFFLAPAAGTARGIAVNPAVTPSSFADSDSGVDRAVARRIADLPSAPDSPSTTWRGTVVDIASKAQAAEIRADLAAQTALKSTLAREAVSGVNLDEEMTNLVAFQHSYAAAARVLTAIDQALDTLINRTGLVGR